MALEYRRHQFRDGRFVTQLRGIAADHLTTVFMDFVVRALELLERSTSQYDSGAQACQLMGDTASETTAAARHKDSLSGEQVFLKSTLIAHIPSHGVSMG